MTASAVTAREEIGRAVADQIRRVQDAGELKRVTDHVLPQIEKFLESYEEKKLRRVRAGVITSAAGAGATVFMILMSVFLPGPAAETLLGVSGLGIAAFLIGIGLIVNALAFTKPPKVVEDRSTHARLQNLLDTDYTPPQLKAQTTSNLSQNPSSVTEHTTLHLKQGR